MVNIKANFILQLDSRCLQNIYLRDCLESHRTWQDRMFLKSIDLTTALRPSYLPDEVLLFVQDNVGLYEGYVHDFRSTIMLYGREGG
jgi:hypothetical protein